eukprot:CAMPEP_0198602120 /NCGR_PEP_ID=MMETSP1462-20131121/150330_1 /TAXON_ID=1333877 /ORGANISM="Brandtodinium nutriculum, Strain RCC3387" /LENGTH=152 /DNA_ID=CAMNT_0044333865 /DNA_START=140 /DNA_END=598 /DNA_ORIENTATION=+
MIISCKMTFAQATDHAKRIFESGCRIGMMSLHDIQEPRDLIEGSAERTCARFESKPTMHDGRSAHSISISHTLSSLKVARSALSLFTDSPMVISDCSILIWDCACPTTSPSDSMRCSGKTPRASSSSLTDRPCDSTGLGARIALLTSAKSSA